MLEGPEKIEISDEQLNEMNAVYSELSEEVSAMLTDFFTPFEIMRSEEIFKGSSAEAYMEFCQLVQNYLQVRFEMSFQDLEKAASNFQNRINEVETFTG